MTPNGEASRAHIARATVLIVAAAACFSTIAIFVTLATRAGAPLLTVLTGRFFFGVLAIAPIAGASALGAAPRATRNALVFRAGALQAALVFCSGASLRWLPAATLVFLFYTYPAFVTLIVAFQRSERISLRRSLALVLSLIGVAIMVGAPGPFVVHPAGAALALASALIFAVYMVYTDRLQTAVSTAVTSFWIAVGAGLTFLVAATVSADLTLSVARPVWFYMAALGVVSTALGYGLFFKGLRTLGPVRTSIISTAEPVWAALLGWIVLAQPVTVGMALGGACIAVAVVLLQWQPRGPVRTQPAAP